MQYKTLNIQNDQNFIYLKSSNDIEPTLITKIAPPSQAITGYELKILLGPTISTFQAPNINLTNQNGIGFAYFSGNPQSTSTQYEPYPGTIHSNRYTNIIYNTNLNDFDLNPNTLIYDPNNTINNDPAYNELRRTLKLLKFVFIQNYTPLQYHNGTWTACDLGSYWILEDVTLLYNHVNGGMVN